MGNSERRFYGWQKEHKTYVRVAVCLIGCYFVYLTIAKGWYWYTPLPALLIPAVSFRREQILSEKGCEVNSFIFGREVPSLWSWDEVHSLFLDTRRAPADHVAFHLGKKGQNYLIRTFFFKKSDVPAIKAFVREMNPKILIDEDPSLQY